VIFTRVAALFGFFAVALGAFGAHGLRARLDAPSLEIWKTAALYHLVHAVAMLALSLARRGRAARAVCALWSAGIVIFGGSLYLLAVTGIRWLGAITPLGGAAFLAGWLVLAVSAVKE
jgi:uncharacterized membrane protein YgdD (TMEM256/DUF423 family)